MTNSQPYLTKRGAQGMAVSIIFTGLATGFVFARLYTRIWLMKRIEANDWMILTALVSIQRELDLMLPCSHTRIGLFICLYGSLYCRSTERNGHARLSHSTTYPGQATQGTYTSSALTPTSHPTTY